LRGLQQKCRALSRFIEAAILDIPAFTPRRIPDHSGDLGYETYFFAESESQRDEFVQRVGEWNVRCVRMTGTYCQYARTYCQEAAVYAPAASPFRDFAEWPAEGYRAEDFPSTESLVSRMVAIPVGVLHTVEDAEYMAAAIRETAADLGLEVRHV